MDYTRVKSRMQQLFTICFAFLLTACKKEKEQAPPNIILFYTDDQGYEDLSSFGASHFSTPNIDRIGEEGIRFTGFYVSNSVSLPSRASLLTGTYPARNLTKVGLPDSLPSSFHDVANIDYNHFSHEERAFFEEIKKDSMARVILQRDGLHPDEITIAELLKQKKYKTAMFGKWHLGYFPEYWPGQQGFDYFFGIPYSHDMYPGNNNPWAVKNHVYFPPLPLIENDSVINYNPDFASLTAKYTRKAKEYISSNKENPFFIYMAYNLPHVPLAASKNFMKNNTASLYGKVMEEIDWSVGEILELLDKSGLEKNTLVLFASDNGPWLSYGNHAGSAGPLREGKGTVFEGGVRVPALAKWPGVIPPGTVCHAPVMTIDILPTIAQVVNAKLPEHGLDGKSILPLMKGEKKTSSRAYLFYGGGNDINEREVLAIRKGKWKLVFPHQYRSLKGVEPGMDGEAVSYISLSTDTALYNLENDVGEKINKKNDRPDIVTKLTGLATSMDSMIKANRRPAVYYMKDLGQGGGRKN